MTPKVAMGKVTEGKKYIKEEQDGITIWYEERMVLDDGRKTADIILQSFFFFFKTPDVEGIKMVPIVLEDMPDTVWD